MADFSLPGKLSPVLLSRFLASVRKIDQQLLVGPEIGVDAAVIDLKGKNLVATSDPITFAGDEIGYYAVQINANDIASTGGLPRWFLATILLPAGRSSSVMVEKIFGDIQATCSAMNITVIGGHTEITRGIDRPIICGHMLGEVPPGRWVTSKGAVIGDTLILTKRLCVEGSSIIARERSEEAVARGVPSEIVARARGFLHTPGISILPESQVATASGAVTAMHDITEGGLSGGLYELASASDVGLLVEEREVPIYPETDALCRAFGLSPWGLIGSGSLLMTVAPQRVEPLLAELARNGIEASVIGTVSARDQGVRLVRGNESRELPSYDRDEISKLFCEVEL